MRRPTVTSGAVRVAGTTAFWPQISAVQPSVVGGGSAVGGRGRALAVTCQACVGDNCCCTASGPNAACDTPGGVATCTDGQNTTRCSAEGRGGCNCTTGPVLLLRS